MQHITPDHGWHDSSAVQAITVSLASRRPSSIEVWADFLRAHDSNRGRKQRVQRALKILRGQARLGSKAANLTERMNPGVRPPRAMQDDVFLRQAPQQSDNFSLNGGLVCLHLPAMEICAVVRDRQLEIAHGKKGISF